MDKIAFVFPGQGSQTQGMGNGLYDGFPSAKDIFEKGSKILGRSLRELCFDTENSVLSETVNSQPAIFTVSLAAAKLLAARGITCSGVCGFSLGEITALTFSGVLTEEDGFAVIGKRAAAMQRAAEGSASGMCAVIGLETETVEDVCRQTSGFVIPVNYNCPKQLVIAGENAAVDAAAEECKKRGALKAVRLSVGAAFHTPLMREASEELKRGMQGISGKRPSIPVYSCVSAGQMENFSDLPEYMRVQMESPVRFESVIRKMIEDGFTAFCEVGTGNVLSGLIKRISRDVKILSAGDPASLASAADALG